MRTCRVVMAEAQGASVIGQGSFSLTSDSFGAQALARLWPFHLLCRLSPPSRQAHSVKVQLSWAT